MLISTGESLKGVFQKLHAPAYPLFLHIAYLIFWAVRRIELWMAIPFCGYLKSSRRLPSPGFTIQPGFRFGFILAAFGNADPGLPFRS
jgi:hypothetical protein